MRFSRQLRDVSEDIPEAFRQLLEQLLAVQEELERTITKLEARVSKLEGE